MSIPARCGSCRRELLLDQLLDPSRRLPLPVLRVRVRPLVRHHRPGGRGAHPRLPWRAGPAPWRAAVDGRRPAPARPRRPWSPRSPTPCPPSPSRPDPNGGGRGAPVRSPSSRARPRTCQRPPPPSSGGRTARTCGASVRRLQQAQLAEDGQDHHQADEDRHDHSHRFHLLCHSRLVRFAPARTFVREPPAPWCECPANRCERLRRFHSLAGGMPRCPLPEGTSTRPGRSRLPRHPAPPPPHPPGLTQADLGRRTGFDGSYVGAPERAAVRPSRTLIERCDQPSRPAAPCVTLWPSPTASGASRRPPAPPPRPAVRPTRAGASPPTRARGDGAGSPGRGVRAGGGGDGRARAGGGAAAPRRRGRSSRGAHPGRPGPAGLRRPAAPGPADPGAAPAAAGRRRMAVAAAGPPALRRRRPGGAEADRDTALRLACQAITPSWPPWPSSCRPPGPWPTAASTTP
jgi:hypothetical protein